jgi:hypothetical protein
MAKTKTVRVGDVRPNPIFQKRLAAICKNAKSVRDFISGMYSLLEDKDCPSKLVQRGTRFDESTGLPLESKWFPLEEQVTDLFLCDATDADFAGWLYGDFVLDLPDDLANNLSVIWQRSLKNEPFMVSNQAQADFLGDEFMFVAVDTKEVQVNELSGGTYTLITRGIHIYPFQTPRPSVIDLFNKKMV